VLIQGWQHYGMIQAAWLAKKAGLTVLMRCEATDHFTSSIGIKKKLREGVVKFLLNQVDKCLAIGKHNYSFYLKRGFPVESIGSMPYCVDNNHFASKAKNANLDQLRQTLSFTEDRPVILYAGKLITRKHPDILLEAYSKLPEPHPYLIFVGDGDLRTSMQETVLKNNLKGVRFAGFANQEDLPAFYGLADIFVLPSINETWGLVINEAMSAGCAIIATDQVGSAIDLVHPGQNGVIVRSCDTQMLSAALLECLIAKKYIPMGIQSLEIIKKWSIDENLVGLKSSLGL
jgi:glycosyltransferase involved in cell wall biosynthesis